MSERQSKLHNVEINLVSGVGPENKVLIDGMEINGIQRVVIEAQVIGPPKVMLELVPYEVLVRLNGAEIAKCIADFSDADLTETTSIGHNVRNYWPSPKLTTDSGWPKVQ
jgi:hypothetical protein